MPRFALLRDPARCEDEGNSSHLVMELAKQVSTLLEKSKDTSCEELALPKSVCEARTRLIQAEPEVRSAIQELEKIAPQSMEITNWARKNAANIFSWTSFIDKRASDGEKKELVDSFLLGQEPDWSKFSESRRNSIQWHWKNMRVIREKFRAEMMLNKEAEPILRKMKGSGYLDDLLIIQSCLFVNQPEVITDRDAALELKVNRLVSQSFPERKFTELDFEEARKCETSIRF
jgi:hypothetical protein